MIGNRYLQALFEYPDEDTSINQLLELLKSKDKKFIDSLCKSIDIEACTSNERIFLTKISALIDYYLQLHEIEVPEWLRDERLSFDKPYYHPKRICDFERFRLFYTNPAPFRTRNVYFDLEGIKRI